MDEIVGVAMAMVVMLDCTFMYVLQKKQTILLNFHTSLQ